MNIELEDAQRAILEWATNREDVSVSIAGSPVVRDGLGDGFLCEVEAMEGPAWYSFNLHPDALIRNVEGELESPLIEAVDDLLHHLHNVMGIRTVQGMIAQLLDPTSEEI